jgi:hypothetical protein
MVHLHVGPACIDISVQEFYRGIPSPNTRFQNRQTRLCGSVVMWATQAHQKTLQAFGLRVNFNARRSRRAQKFWQGWKESNLRMPESKSGALTNLATPLHRSVVMPGKTRPDNQPINRSMKPPLNRLPTGQGMHLKVAAFAYLPVLRNPCHSHPGQVRLMRQMRKYRASRAGHASLQSHC